MVELHWEGSAPTACGAGLFLLMNGKFLLSGTGDTPALHFHWVFLTTSCTEQFEALKEELAKRRQECLELTVIKEEDAALVLVKTPRGTLRGQAQIKEFLGVASYNPNYIFKRCL